MSEKEQRLTAYHEAGHTLVGLYCEHATPLHKVTIMPRGNAYLGATMYLPENDSYTQSRSELVDAICVSMGGRMAEEIEFGEITNGAASDIKHATSIARHMVRDWGMSDEMGFVKYSHDDKESYQFQNEYSETTGKRIDEEVRRIVDEQFERARKILTDHRDQLTLLSETLLKKETMTAYEVKKLLGFEVEEDEDDSIVKADKEKSDEAEESGKSDTEKPEDDSEEKNSDSEKESDDKESSADSDSEESADSEENKSS